MPRPGVTAAACIAVCILVAILATGRRDPQGPVLRTEARGDPAPGHKDPDTGAPSEGLVGGDGAGLIRLQLEVAAKDATIGRLNRQLEGVTAENRQLRTKIADGIASPKPIPVKPSDPLNDSALYASLFTHRS